MDPILIVIYILGWAGTTTGLYSYITVTAVPKTWSQRGATLALCAVVCLIWPALLAHHAIVKSTD